MTAKKQKQMTHQPQKKAAKNNRSAVSLTYDFKRGPKGPVSFCAETRTFSASNASLIIQLVIWAHDLPDHGTQGGTNQWSYPEQPKLRHCWSIGEQRHPSRSSRIN